MTRQVFIDSSAWVAIAFNDDAHHESATSCYKKLLSNGVFWITTSFVVAETYTLIRKRIGHSAGVLFLQGTNDSPRVRVLYPDQPMEIKAKEILIRYADQDFSLTDAISFACLRDLGIDEAFSYDRHFLTAGFTLVNGP